MIVVDSSALIAVLEKEPDAGIYAAALRQAEQLFVSAVNVYETGTVLRIRRGPAAVARMWRFLEEENDFEVVPFDRQQAEAALTAFDRYGKGSTRKPASTLPTVRLMRWPPPGICPCCSKAAISARRTCNPAFDHWLAAA